MDFLPGHRKARAPVAARRQARADRAEGQRHCGPRATPARRQRSDGGDRNLDQHGTPRLRGDPR